LWCTSFSCAFYKFTRVANTTLSNWGYQLSYFSDFVRLDGTSAGDGDIPRWIQTDFSYTPDGDGDRSWILVTRPNGTFAYATIDYETSKCWPSLFQTDSKISFSCVDGWGGARERLTLTEALTIRPEECLYCTVSIRDLNFDSRDTGGSLLYLRLIPIIQLVSPLFGVGILFVALTSVERPLKTLIRSRNFAIFVLITALISYVVYWCWIFFSITTQFFILYLKEFLVLVGPSLFPIILVLGYGISAFLTRRFKSQKA